jgi:hypothetical protein
MTLRKALVAALVVSACATGGADLVRAQAAASSNSNEILHYSAEWRFVRSGDIEVHNLNGRQTVMKLFSAGLVSRLFQVEDSYTLTRDEQGCNKSLVFNLREGRRNRDIRANFDKQRRKATYVEKDLNRNVVTTQKESDIPGCVYDLTGALRQLRYTYPKPGTSWTVPISDGKKTANIRVEAQEKELIRTPLGQFPSTRYEAFIFSGVFYGRMGRLFVWVTDDERHLPIQLRIQLPFYVGTITLQLERIERN